MTDSRILDRLRACAVGAAVGDALGMPLEFGPSSPAERLVWDMRPSRLPAGSFTDDTEMALAVSESLLAHAPLDGDDLSQRFVAWYESRPPDVGFQTGKALGWISGGMSWQKASQRMQKEMPDGAGNGSVMRCYPVALKWWHDRSHLIADSRLQSQITHPHPECVAGSIFINIMISELVNGANPVEALGKSLTLVELPTDLRRVIEQAPLHRRDGLVNSGWVRHTLESAIWGLLTTSSFEDAVVMVVNLGNDADTAGSVVGALAGAAYGLDAIPQSWRSQLRGKYPINSGHDLTSADFIRLADRLAQNE